MICYLDNLWSLGSMRDQNQYRKFTNGEKDMRHGPLVSTCPHRGVCSSTCKGYIYTHTHRQRHADRQTDKEGIVNMKRGEKISMNMNTHFITDCWLYFRVKENWHHLQNFPSQRILRNHMPATEHIPLVAQEEPKVLRKNNNKLEKALLRIHQNSWLKPLSQPVSYSAEIVSCSMHGCEKHH